ncbi:MAG: hypothetical protein QOJ46_1500 [bacterium]|jgi:hypothetical protein
MATSTTPPGPGPAAESGAARAHRTLATVFLAGAVIQFFLAGLGAFKFDPEDSSAFDAHRIVGDLLGLIALIVLVLAVVGRKQAQQASIVLFVLMIVQNVLGAAGASAPVIGALHPINGLLILGVAGLAIAGRPVQLRHHHGGVGA